MKQRHLIYLIAGIVVTALFFIFRVDAYEWLFYDGGYSNDMYNTNLYTIIAAITVGMSWGAAAIYYYIINSVRFDRWYHWLALMAAITVVTPVICYAVNTSVFDSIGKTYVTQAVSLELANMGVTAVLCIVASFSMRWWSSNCRHTPIPQ